MWSRSRTGRASAASRQSLRRLVHAFIRSECEEATMRKALKDAAAMAQMLGAYAVALGHRAPRVRPRSAVASAGKAGSRASQ